MLPAALRGNLINPKIRRGGSRLAMIDFDGTISLLREGWDKIMVPMMVQVLLPLPGSKETSDDLTKEVQEWVFKLNGQPTIKQMEALAEEVKKRGGSPAPASSYKQEYLRRLMMEVNRRKALILSGHAEPSEWVVPGSYLLLQELRRRGMPMILSSGTDLGPLQEEAALLKVTEYFAQGIFGPENDASTFTKAKAADDVLQKLGLSGRALLNIGDGYVETKLTKERGGVALGVAFDSARPGEYHAWRLEQLMAAGADLIVPDLRQSDQLLRWLFEE